MGKKDNRVTRDARREIERLGGIYTDHEAHGKFIRVNFTIGGHPHSQNLSIGGNGTYDTPNLRKYLNRYAKGTAQ
jgi:hypothetical protein